MISIEVNVPAERLDRMERVRLAESLTAHRLLGSAEETGEIGADPGVLALYESLTTVSVREHDVWIADRVTVDLTVGTWAKDMASHLVAAVSRRLEEAGFEQSIVYVRGIAEGCYGLDGEIVGISAFTGMIDRAKVNSTEDAPEGSFIDPVCGAVVPAEQAVLLELDGEVHGFCCPGCRGHFAKKRRKTL
ncbi:hypothetical protein [Salininema proteolyticum]|uniref:TRASH domain-containing protein n=1 Tax=Salininema proteolyticum TaxID=1607685 RepID=A0ABV8TVI9_9ACTN